MSVDGLPTLDVSLLSGFSFDCRPGCGLCCYATPVVRPEERDRLRQVEPDFPLREGSHGRGETFLHISSRPEGGACHFLQASRCRCHQARPFPCREFPLHVVLNRRPQATVVLSCPGVDLASLSSGASDAPLGGSPRGLESELAAVREELRRPGVAGRIARASDRWDRALRRAHRTERGLEAEDLVHELARRPRIPTEIDLEEVEPPPEGEELDRLPLFLDERHGVLALRTKEEGWEVLALQEQGGIRESIGTYPAPTSVPRLDGPARRALEGYLSYAIRRDQFLSLSLHEWQAWGEGSLREVAEGLVSYLAATVLTRATVGCLLQGLGHDRLGLPEVLNGVRATDMDFLDQPTLGELL